MNAIRCLMPAVLAAATAFAQSPRPEFEVASIRAADMSNANQVNIGVHVDGAQLSMNYFSLKDYIRIAYELQDYQVVGPDWLATQRFDIVAKLPATAGRGQVNQMLRSLLEDRFKIKTHMDQKDFSVYALIPGKGGIKLKPSIEEPASDDPPPASVNIAATGGPRGVSINLGRGSYFSFADNKLEAKKLDMTRFCDTLGRFEDKPVVDMTGLTGNYDVTLNLTEEDYRAMLIRSAISGGYPVPPQALRALELSSGDSLASALQAVGLKLEARKAPLPVLVVDRMEKTPTEN